MLISGLVPLAMDGLSVALASNACSPWNSGAWDSRFEIRDSRSKKDSRLEIRGQQRNDHRDPGANQGNKAPFFTPVFISPPLPSFLPPFSPFFLRQSCANSTNLLSTISPSNLQAQRLLHSPSAAPLDPCQRQCPGTVLFFCHSRLTARFWQSLAGPVHPLTPSVPILCIVAEASEEQTLVVAVTQYTDPNFIALDRWQHDALYLRALSSPFELKNKTSKMTDWPMATFDMYIIRSPSACLTGNMT